MLIIFVIQRHNFNFEFAVRYLFYATKNGIKILKLFVYTDSDKLVDIWYLKNLSDQFSTKIHVTSKYYDFVMQFVSQFINCFSFTPPPSIKYNNNVEQARIHYDCNCFPSSSSNSIPGTTVKKFLFNPFLRKV